VFKRLLGGLVHKWPEDDSAGPSAAAPDEKAEFITTCDTYGREIRIRRQAWRANVLLPSLGKAWNDPEALYAHLVSALDHGFAGDLDAASKRLLAIDPSPQRAQAVRSIVLMETGRLSDPLAPHGREAPPAAAAPDAPETDTVGLDRPVWSYGLRNPTWLFTEKPAEAPLVSFIGFARRVPPADHLQEQHEDQAGALCRSAALYLAEAVHQWTGLRTSTVIPVIDGGGPLVLDAGARHADLCARFGEHSAYLVSGEVGCDAGGWHIVCRLWDGASRACLAQETIEAPAHGIGAAMLELERRLLAHLGRARAAPVDGFYARPPEDAMAPYLAVLGHGFILTLAANGVMPRDLLRGERAMLEWPLDLALQWPAAEVPTLMLLSGLAKAAAYGSGIVHEFKARTIDLMQDARRAGSAVARLEPLALQVFGLRDELVRQQASLGPDAADDYRQWLARRIAETGEAKSDAFAPH
jgi:hypothetical protein